MKRRCLILCVLLLCCLAASAFGETTLHMMGFDALSDRNWEESLFFERMEARTGIHLTFDRYEDEASYQRAKDRLAAGDSLPDVLFKAELTASEELSLAQSGVLIDLLPLLAEHAPNLWRLLEENPAWREAITLPDGRIVALPTLSSPSRQVIWWINREWLEALELSMPEDREGLRAVLEAFQSGDPNGNYRADEVPLLLVGPWEAKWLMHGFGLTADEYNLCLDGDGQVRYVPLESAFYEYLLYMQELLDAGLINSDAFRQLHAMLDLSEQEVSPVRIGTLLSFAPYTLLDLEATLQYDALPPLQYQGEQVYRDFLGDVWRGTFAITSACEDPAAALRWVDLLYTEEGATLAYMGEEDAEWTTSDVDPDSELPALWNFLIDDYRSYTAISAESLIADSAAVPGIDPAHMWEVVDNAAERHVIEQNRQVAAVSTQPMPPLYPTAEQLAAADALQEALGAHVDTEIARFITGERPLSPEEFAVFQQELLDMGAQDLVAVWQEVVDGRFVLQEELAQ